MLHHSLLLLWLLQRLRVLLPVPTIDPPAACRWWPAAGALAPLGARAREGAAAGKDAGGRLVVHGIAPHARRSAPRPNPRRSAPRAAAAAAAALGLRSDETRGWSASRPALWSEGARQIGGAREDGRSGRRNRTAVPHGASLDHVGAGSLDPRPPSTPRASPAGR